MCADIFGGGESVSKGKVLDYAEAIYDEEDADLLYEYEAAYLPFEPLPQNRSATEDVNTMQLMPTQELPDYCRDAYFSRGSLCYDPEIPSMDIVWTWVNGSDSLLQEAKLLAESRFSSDDPYRPKTSFAEARQYR